MKTAETKTTSHQHQGNSAKPFFDANHEQKFFGAGIVQTKLFFQPQYTSSELGIQRQCRDCGIEQQGQPLPQIQRQPIFESENVETQSHLQRQATTSDTAPVTYLQPQEEATPELEETSGDLASPVIQSKGDGSIPPGDGDNSFRSDTETPFFQAKLTVGEPGDRYEKEAEAIAHQVVSQPQPSQQPTTHPAVTQLQRANNEQPGSPIPTNLESRLQQAQSSGTPLDTQTRLNMEAGFGADFSQVRVHTGQDAASLARSLGAVAFTTGNHIFFNTNQYQPASATGRNLLAHELTHTLQQDAAIQRQPAVSSTSHTVQMLPESIIGQINDYARYIPGYTLFTVVIGFNPLTGNAVERNASNLLEGLMGLVPFGTFIFDKLREMGILQSAFTWVEGELGRLDLSVGRIERTLEAAWEDIHLVAGFDDNLAVLRQNFQQLYQDVEAFARSLINQIIQLIKDAAINLAEGLLANNQAWALIKKILKHDPLRNQPVAATTVEILEDFLRLIGKEQELEQMQERGTLEQTAAWLDTQVGTFISLLGELGSLFTSAWDAIQPENLPNLSTNLESIINQTIGFLQRVWDFAITVAAKVLELIKQALLGWLSSFAIDIPGYHLLTVIMGKDIFTEQSVPRTVINIIRGFMSLLPNGEQKFQQMQETGVIPRAAQRIEALMGELGISWPFVQELFLNIWNTLTIEDMVTPIDTFIRVLEQFREPLNRLLTFVIEVVKIVLELLLEIMNFPSDIIGNIMNNALQALDDIQQDPVGFLLNLLRAVKTGFTNFFDNILQHLLSGVTDWLFGQVRKAGIEPPTEITLESILNLVLQVLGVSMDRIWSKLGDRIGQENVARIRGAIDRLSGIWNFVRDVQQRGIAAIWEYIQTQISNLWNMVLEQVRSWIVSRIIDRVIAKIVSMLDPTGIMAVVNSFIAFFNAVQSAIEYFREILEIVDSFVGMVAEIASGSIDQAAQFLENLLAQSLPVAIGFLANQVGLGNIGDKLQEIIAGIQGLIDQALDWLIDRAVNLGQGLLNAIGLGEDNLEETTGEPDTPESQALKQEVALAVQQAFAEEHTGAETESIIARIRSQFQAQGLDDLFLEPNSNGTGFILYAKASPKYPLGIFQKEANMTQAESEQMLHSAIRLTLVDSIGFNRQNIPLVESTEKNIGIGGEAWQPENLTTEIRAVTWNTSGANRRNNITHAERQFMNWITNPSQENVLLKLKKLEIQNINESPCGACSNQLAHLIREIREKQTSAGQVYLEEAHLYWTKRHLGESPTSASDITILRASGWTLHAPQNQLPIQGIEDSNLQELPGVLEYEPGFNPNDRAVVIHPPASSSSRSGGVRTRV